MAGYEPAALPLSYIPMAGIDRIELSYNGVKVRCLTTWLNPCVTVKSRKISRLASFVKETIPSRV